MDYKGVSGGGWHQGEALDGTLGACGVYDASGTDGMALGRPLMPSC